MKSLSSLIHSHGYNKLFINERLDSGQVTKNEIDRALVTAVNHCHIELAELFINYGADINSSIEMSGLGYEMTLIQLAVLKKNPKILGMLLDAGADVNKKSGNGSTALDLAIHISETDKHYEGDIEIILALLLSKGAKSSKELLKPAIHVQILPIKSQFRSRQEVPKHLLELDLVKEKARDDFCRMLDSDNENEKVQANFLNAFANSNTLTREKSRDYIVQKITEKGEWSQPLLYALNKCCEINIDDEKYDQYAHLQNSIEVDFRNLVRTGDVEIDKIIENHAKLYHHKQFMTSK